MAQVRVQVKSRYATDCDRGFPVKEASLDAFDFLIVTFLNIGKFFGLHSGGETLHRVVGPAIKQSTGWSLRVLDSCLDPATGLREYEKEAEKLRKGWGLEPVEA